MSAKVCAWCLGTKFDTQTNGFGSLVDRCANPSCRKIWGRGKATGETGRASVTTAMAPSNSAKPLAARPCAVEGCPGTQDVTGKCLCCEERKKWRRANLPPRLCEICGGEIPEPPKRKRYCGACKPLRPLVYSRRSSERQKAQKGKKKEERR